MTEQKALRLAVSCGGTGGHFYPGLSVAREVIASGGEAVLLLSGVNMDRQSEIAAGYGVPSVKLAPMPSPRRIRNQFGFLCGLVKGMLQSYREMRRFKPDALLGMGAFVLLPPFLAAKLARIPVYLHDGNARIGKANRLLSFGAKQLWSAFPPVNADACHCPVSAIGMPLRQELVRQKPSRLEAFQKINQMFKTDFDPGTTLVLVFGGSQGAQVFNELLPEALAAYAKFHPVQVIHLTGAGHLEATAQRYETLPFKHYLATSCEEMQFLYAAADLGVCRSGGSTSAELTAFALPAFLIPYPSAAENHQMDNAHVLTDAGAALLLEQKDCTSSRIGEVISTLLNDPVRLKMMRDASAKLARPDAAKDVVAAISSARK